MSETLKPPRLLSDKTDPETHLEIMKDQEEEEEAEEGTTQEMIQETMTCQTIILITTLKTSFW